jgi:hypothetical protein
MIDEFPHAGYGAYPSGARRAFGKVVRERLGGLLKLYERKAA